MATRAVLDFRKAVNDNPAIQEEIRALTERGAFDPVEFAKKHGFQFSRGDLTKTLGELTGKLSELELTLISRQRKSAAMLKDLAVREAELVMGGKKVPNPPSNSGYA